MGADLSVKTKKILLSLHGIFLAHVIHGQQIAMNDNNQEAIYAILDFCLEFHFILFI